MNKLFKINLFGTNTIEKNERALEKLTETVISGSHLNNRYFLGLQIEAYNFRNPRDFAKFIVRTICFQRVIIKTNLRYERIAYVTVISVLVIGNIWQYCRKN